MNIENGKPRSYKYRVYDTLKNQIISGEIPKGTVLSERKLSEALGISRTPIREAMHMLAQDGWLTMETYHGAVVKEYDKQTLVDILRLRSVLECFALELAIDHVTPEDIAILRKFEKKQNDGKDDLDDNIFILTDRQLHTFIYELSGNKELVHLLSNYYDIFAYMGVRAISQTASRRVTTLQEHKNIVDAMEARDKEAAVNAMKNHMEQTLKNILSKIEIHGME